MVAWHISPRIATAALVGLLALDVTLVAMALRSTRASDIDTKPLSSASALVDSPLTPGPTGPTNSSTAASPTTPATPTTAAKVPLRTMLVALDSQHAWRVDAGSCSAGGARVATTVDGGRTWANGNVKLRRIVRLRATDHRAAFIIGSDASCAAELRDTSDAGMTWTPGGSVARSWFREPGSPMVVRAPGSLTSQPCGTRAVLDLAVLTTRSVRVLCADGLVRSTTDTGSVWSSQGTVEGAVALAVPTAKQAVTYVARQGVPGCAGVQILRFPARVAVSCVRISVPPGPGQIAISLIDGGGWLAIGNATMRSNDNLATWRAS